ncbi:MAG: hypothetical protein ACREAN_03200 [Nitrosopumilaceae archaeon]
MEPKNLPVISFLIAGLVLLVPQDEAAGFFLAPLKQVKLGISAQDIKCNEGLVLVLKLKDGSPACVRPTTVPRLQSNGWLLGPYNNVSSKGLLVGTVTFYPCSPVEQIGEPPCTGNGHNYTVTVYQSDAKTIAGQTSSNQNGVYSIELPQGNYTVFTPYSAMYKSLGKQHIIQIEVNKTTIFNIVIDSGIR